MPISYHHNVIFIHIPKTAGEAIEKCLEMYDGGFQETLWGVTKAHDVLQHKTAEGIQLMLNNSKLWHEFFKFSVVRNPWSKAVSEYHWYLRYGPRCTFKTWLFSLDQRIALNRTINIAEIGHNLPQYLFLYNECGYFLVDRIIKYENLDCEFRSLLKELNIKATLMYNPHTSSIGLTKDFRCYYDEESISIVEKIYKKDLLLFGYDRNSTFGSV